jgi:hypothetical protein
MLTTIHMTLLIVLKIFTPYFLAHSNRSPKFPLLYIVLSWVLFIGPTSQLYEKRERRNRGRMKGSYI